MWDSLASYFLLLTSRYLWIRVPNILFKTIAIVISAVLTTNEGRRCGWVIKIKKNSKRSYWHRVDYKINTYFVENMMYGTFSTYLVHSCPN